MLKNQLIFLKDFPFFLRNSYKKCNFNFFVDEKVLLKIVIICSIIMIPLTSFFLSLSSKEIHYLTLKGDVKSVKQGDVTFLTLRVELPVVFFDNIEINSSRVLIKGNLEEYKGRLEFIGKEVSNI